MSVKEQLYELQNQSAHLKNQCDRLQAMYNAEKYRENEKFIGTAWVNESTDNFYFVLDYNPSNIYSCVALHFKKQNFSAETLQKNEYISHIDYITLSFTPTDFSQITCETTQILLSQLIKCKEISTEEFFKELNLYTKNLIEQIPALCKEKHEKEIAEVYKEEY